MLPRLLLVVTCFLACTFQLRAQIYEPGLLVRFNGDTLRGEIENGFWEEPPAFIHFRATANSASELFRPEQLRVVSFTGGRYFRYERLPIDHSTRVKIGSLPYGNTPAIHVDSLLAEVLVDGAVTLERVVLPENTHYLLLRSGQPPVDLSERKYLRKAVDGAWLLTDGNNYRGQLGVYFSDCPAANTAGQMAPFTAKGLADVVQVYNNICGKGTRPSRNLLAQVAPRRRVAFRGGVLAGLRYNRIESRDPSQGQDCGDCKTHPYAGLYIDVFQPGRTFALYGELSVSKFNNQGSQYQGYIGNGPDIYSHFDYESWLMTARFGIRYFHPLPRGQQFLIGFGYELNGAFQPTVTTPLTGPTAPRPEEMGFAATTLFPNLGIGWRRGRITVSLDGQMYFTSDREAGFGATYFTNNIATRVGVGYRLGRNPDAVSSASALKP